LAIQGSRPQNRIILVIGVVLALVAGALAFVAVTKGVGGTGQTADVYVAIGDVQAGTALAPDQFQKVSVSTNAVPADAVQNISDITGKTAPITLTKNAVLTLSFVNAATNNPTGIPGAGGSHLAITKNYVALAIPVKGTTVDASTELVTVGYYIQPEDHIDILVDAADQAGTGHTIRYGFQDVRVLKVGGVAAPAPAAAPASGAAAPAAVVLPVPTFYIIELPRSQAELMTLLMSGRACSGTCGGGGGNLVTAVKYVLRPVDEYGKTVKDPNATNPNAPNFTAPVYEPATGGNPPTVADPGAGPSQIASAFPHG
jgi:Flp pilus assembly protein CpaB